MARTRAQSEAGAEDAMEGKTPTITPQKRDAPEPEPVPGDTEAEEEPQGGEAAGEGEPAKEPPAKKTKEEGDVDVAKEGTSRTKTDCSKIGKLIDEYGAFPLTSSALSDPTKPTTETMLAHLLNSLLSTTRISHHLAAKTVKTVIQAGWADFERLQQTSWEKKTEVLTEGGYTRYREKTATQLDDLAGWLRSKYDGDLNNLLQAAKDESGDDHTKIRDGVRKRLEEVKGLGKVALDVFCDTAQGLWHELAPFLDSRSDSAAERVGLPTNVQELYDNVERDPVQMCRLAAALTTMRLDKKEDEVAEMGEETQE